MPQPSHDFGVKLACRVRNFKLSQRSRKVESGKLGLEKGPGTMLNKEIAFLFDVFLVEAKHTKNLRNFQINLIVFGKISKKH